MPLPIVIAALGLLGLIVVLFILALVLSAKSGNLEVTKCPQCCSHASLCNCDGSKRW